MYVPHGAEVVGLDLDSGAVIGKVEGFSDAHGVVIAHDVGKGFVSASDPGSVTIF